MGGNGNGVKEVKREKVIIPSRMTIEEIMEKYGLKLQAAQNAKKKGFFVKNYSKPQVKIDPSKFDTDICYRIARKVFKTNLSFDPVAVSNRDDLLQHAVLSMWEKSEILKSSKKYSINYQYYFVVRNYMNSYLSKWKRQVRYKDIFHEFITAVKYRGRRVYDPVFKWVSC